LIGIAFPAALLRATKRRVLVARYRLRFHLQEVDLQRGVTLIGRSEDCEVTIEDPLVSRRHARILIDGDDVTLEDLGSRNGVRLNGKPLRGSARVVDGDRVRIGTQEFVLCRFEADAARRAKTTGVLRLCAHCKLPYAREMVSCPNCGATEQTDDETLSGSFGASSQHSWSVQLLIEALEKAILLQRPADADRILRRATTLLEERMASGGTVNAEQIVPLARVAARLCVDQDDPAWGTWIASFYTRAAIFPPAVISEDLARLLNKYVELKEFVDPLIARARLLDGTPSREDSDALARLSRRAAAADDTGQFEAEKPTAVPPKN
jgi:pSer/pThr/pTyr-binding forkhead associated (FHA) protein